MPKVALRVMVAVFAAALVAAVVVGCWCCGVTVSHGAVGPRPVVTGVCAVAGRAGQS
ncbi:hypothetical protein O1L44_25950 [Streptomyces noursei]|nr:hypothetical protein [Streptomyces noursei]